MFVWQDKRTTSDVAFKNFYIKIQFGICVYEYESELRVSVLFLLEQTIATGVPYTTQFWSPIFYPGDKNFINVQIYFSGRSVLLFKRMPSESVRCIPEVLNFILLFNLFMLHVLYLVLLNVHVVEQKDDHKPQQRVSRIPDSLILKSS